MIETKMEKTKKPVVVGIGELLWDLFPDGDRLGGAPLNFCYHAQQLGAKGIPVSAVGRDELGQDLRQALYEKGIADQFVETVSRHPTGTVSIALDPDGKPAYTIHEPVAWDALSHADSLTRLARRTDAVCFGSLAQRSEASRKTIHAFLQATSNAALRIFDVNLRQDFYSKEIIDESLRLANILKLSDEELPVLAKMFRLSGSVAEQLEVLRERFGLRLVAYTRGAAGSLLLSPDEVSDHPGCPGDAINSVGAGDAFTAALCMGLLNGDNLDETNEHANRVATFVCSQDGATPILPESLISGREGAQKTQKLCEVEK